MSEPMRPPHLDHSLLTYSDGRRAADWVARNVAIDGDRVPKTFVATVAEAAFLAALVTEREAVRNAAKSEGGGPNDPTHWVEYWLSAKGSDDRFPGKAVCKWEIRRLRAENQMLRLEIEQLKEASK